MTYETDLRLFINGVWQSAEDRARFTVIDPVDGEPIAELPLASSADLDEALAAAERTYPQWRRTDVDERSRILRGTASLLRERIEGIARTLTREQGKIIAESRAEVVAAAQLFEWYSEEVRRDYGRVLVRPAGELSRVVREPVGPVAAFTP